MLREEQNAEECDATDYDLIAKADQKKIIFSFKFSNQLKAYYL